MSPQRDRDTSREFGGVWNQQSPADIPQSRLCSVICAPCTIEPAGTRLRQNPAQEANGRFILLVLWFSDIYDTGLITPEPKIFIDPGEA